MTEDTTYNGWTNRETWLVALWINNEQGWQESVHDALREAVGEVIVGDQGYEQADVPLKDWQAGDIVKDNVEEAIYDVEDVPTAGLASDLIGTALGAVDWTEIGASFLSDVAEQEASA